MRERSFGLDLIRLVSFGAICFHHLSAGLSYPSVAYPWRGQSVVADLLETYARVFSFSGFTVLFLTSFLHGASGHKNRSRFLFPFLFLGWVVFSLLFRYDEPFWLIWDVYPLILLGFVSVRIADRFGKPVAVVLPWFGFGLLLIPFWEVGAAFQSLGLWVQHALVGNCAEDLAEWPILPWIGLIWAGYGLGRWWVRQPVERLYLRPPEGTFWMIALLATMPFLGAYYHVELGSEFACYVFRQPPSVFWAHLVWPLFAMRLALDPRVSAFLGRFRFCRGVGRLRVSTHFWVAYVIHYPLAYFLARLPYGGGHPDALWVALTYAALLVSTELVARLFVHGFSSALQAAGRKPRWRSETEPHDTSQTPSGR